jgi:hypothetical protein
MASGENEQNIVKWRWQTQHIAKETQMANTKEGSLCEHNTLIFKGGV